MAGPGHAPIPGKLVSKIISSHFFDLVDLLLVNLCALENKLQMFLGKLEVSTSKQGQVELRDILTWTEAFTAYQMVMWRLIRIGGLT